MNRTAAPACPVPSAQAPVHDRCDLLLAGLLGLLFLALLCLPASPNRFGDQDFYLEARALAAALAGRAPWQEAAVTKAPGPVLFYTVPFLALPDSAPPERYWLAAVLWSGAWTTASVLLVRRTAARLAGPAAGRVAGACAVALPLCVYYSLGILAEPPAFAGAALLAWGWTRWWRRHAFRGSLLSPLAAGGGLLLLLLSRPNAALVVPLAATAAVATAWRTRSGAGRGAARATGCLLVGVALAACLLQVGLGRLPGRRTAVRQHAYLSYVVLHGRFQYRAEPWNWSYWDQDRAGTPDYDAWLATQAALETEAAAAGQSLDALRRRWIVQDHLAHPLLALRQALTRCLTLNLLVVHSAAPERFALGPIPGPVVYLAAHLLVNGCAWLLLAAAAAGLWRGRAEALNLWPLAGPWLALLLFSASTYAEPRYLFPAQPGLLVLAGAGLAVPVQRLAARLRRRGPA